MPKTRSDAVLLNLPEEQQAQLAEWLLSGMPYHRAQAEVEKSFGVKVSLATFSAFWAEVCQPQLLARRARAVQTSEEVAAEALKNPGQFDEATIDSLKRRAFELSIAPDANPKDVKAIFALVLKARDQELDAREQQLNEKRFKRETAELFLQWSANEKAKSIVDSDASNDTKTQQLIKLMFGEVVQ